MCVCMYACVVGCEIFLCIREKTIYSGDTLTMRPTNTHSSPTVIPDSPVATHPVSPKTIKATDKKQKQNLNQTTMTCAADGEQKSEAKKGEGELSSTIDYREGIVCICMCVLCACR